MRLQLDPALTGTGITGAGEAGQTAPAGSANVGSANAAGANNTGRIGGTTAGGDSIQISGPSNALNSLSADRAARIQQLTQQVQSGSYQVSGSLVSRAIVGDAVSQASKG
jgi:anti-sigma28 factor (negative regulator of flagellin synthesis)